MLDNPENIIHQKVPKIRSYSEETRLAHVGSWKASGLSMTQYSERQGVSVSALSKWIKYYGDKVSNGQFKEVCLKPSLKSEHSYPSATPILEIKMPNGVQLKLPVDNKSFSLSQLLGVLSQCS